MAVSKTGFVAIVKMLSRSNATNASGSNNIYFVTSITPSP